MINYKIMLLFMFITISLTGCSSYYCNYTNPNRMFNNDYELCTQYVNNKYNNNDTLIQPSQSQNSIRNITVVDNRGRVYTGTAYTHNIRTFSDDVNDINAGLSALNMIFSRIGRIVSHDECLKNLGWKKVTKEEYIDFLNKINARNVDRVEDTRTQIYTEEDNFKFIVNFREPKYYQIMYVDDDINTRNIINNRIKAWIKSKRKNERNNYEEIYNNKKDANKYCDMLKTYKAENKDSLF